MYIAFNLSSGETATGSSAGCREFQACSLDELEEKIRDAYRMMLEEQEAAPVTGSIETRRSKFRREAPRICAGARTRGLRARANG